MTLAELIEEFHDWPGCQELTDEQIKTLIEQLSRAHLASENVVPKLEPRYFPTPKFQSS